MVRPMERPLLAMASAQHGVVATYQAKSLGSEDQVEYEFTRPPWRREAPQVYSVDGAPSSPLRSAMVKLLRSGPGAVVSHHSALWLWGVIPEPQITPVHVTRMRGSNGVKVRAEGIFPHETRRMPTHHVTVHRSFPIVTPARALADVAANTPSARVARWLDRAWTLRLVDYRAMNEVLVDLAKPGRRGIRPLRRLVEKRGPSYVAPASGLESRLNAILGRADMTVRRQVDLGARQWLGRVDFLVDGTPLIIEVQSDAYHWSMTSSEDDHLRQAALEAEGFSVLPIWEAQVWSEEAEVRAAVEAALREARR